MPQRSHDVKFISERLLIIPSVEFNPSMPDPQHARLGHISAFDTAPSSPPIYQTTAFDIADLDVLAQLHTGESKGHIYTRDSNPNRAALADSIALLEGAEAGGTFSSGMGAIAAITMAMVKTGEHVIVGRSMYGITLKLMARMQKSFGVEVSYVDVCDIKAVSDAVRTNTKMCLIETISNPLLEVADVQAVSAALGDVPLVVDSTFTTPELIQPLQHGASIVMHSASKYLNGHGDVMLGLAVGRSTQMKSINATASTFGQNSNAFESWLTQRGLRTLPLRMKQIVATTNKLAEFLSSHPAVALVNHPTLKHHDTHDTANRLYPNGTGGIISFELKAEGKAGVSTFMRAAAEIPFSPTLADSRTTISHPATTSHGFMSRRERADLGIKDELVRLSVGLEDAALLQQELDVALKAI